MSFDERSEESLAFQSQWEALRGIGELVPARSAFLPSKFIEFLPSVVLVEIDLVARTMLVKLAGSGIRGFLGFELTGRDFLAAHIDADVENAWEHRRAYHDHPCGRYEVLDMKFSGDVQTESSLTILPLRGPGDERLIVLYAEPRKIILSEDKPRSDIVSSPAKFVSYIDLGAGIPA